VDGVRRLNNHSRVTKLADRLWRQVKAGDPESRCKAAEELLTLYGVNVAVKDRDCDLLGGLKSRDTQMVVLATDALETLIRQLQECRRP